MHDTAPTVNRGNLPEFDARANRGGALLVLGPAVFLVQFATLYALNALACRFQWTGTLAGFPLMPALSVVLTLLAIAVVLLAAHGARSVPTEGEPQEYDLDARRAFVAKARVMVSWLSAGAMLLVMVPALLTPPCT